LRRFKAFWQAARARNWARNNQFPGWLARRAWPGGLETKPGKGFNQLLTVANFPLFPSIRLYFISLGQQEANEGFTLYLQGFY